MDIVSSVWSTIMRVVLLCSFLKKYAMSSSSHSAPSSAMALEGCTQSSAGSMYSLTSRLSTTWRTW